jgi:hypothetical protein
MMIDKQFEVEELLSQFGAVKVGGGDDFVVWSLDPGKKTSTEYNSKQRSKKIRRTQYENV